MFRINYTDLTKKQVEDILRKGLSPSCASQLCTKLSGKTMKIVFDKLPVEGSALEYEFKSETRLVLRENCAAPIECDYGALTLNEITLFSHMIPGTKKGYTVIVNWVTTVVTAFEMWFTDFEGVIIDTEKEIFEHGDAGKLGVFVNREVQRHYYFGYFETPDKKAPVNRDRITLRLENCMINWKDDRGKNRLYTYTSSTYTTLVELDVPDGGDVLTFVSDILQINDSMFIHCFGEVEYSGRLSIEVLDLFKMEKIGVSVGIDENDSFEFALYKGQGKFLGKYATFYDFNDRGNKYPESVAGRLDFSVKGARSSYRPSIMFKKMTSEDLVEAAKNASILKSSEENVMVSAQHLAQSDYCAGKNITFRDDTGFAVKYSFLSASELEYCYEGEDEWHNEEYYATMLDDGLIILGHYRTGSYPPGCHVLALDFKNGLATCIDAKFGGKYDLRDIDPTYRFGYFEMGDLAHTRVFRHGFTDELLGYAFTWTYSDQMSSTHIYNSPHSYSWTIFSQGTPGTPGNRAGGPVWSSPCEYIKLRDDVYIMNWIEQKWEGLMGCACMNLRIMHDCGFVFGASHDNKSIFLDIMGALCRPAGYIDLSGIYQLRNVNKKA